MSGLSKAVIWISPARKAASRADSSGMICQTSSSASGAPSCQIAVMPGHDPVLILGMIDHFEGTGADHLRAQVDLTGCRLRRRVRWQ